MPLFEYRCDRCGIALDELQSEPKPPLCPKCEHEMRRRFSSFRTIVDFRPGWDQGLGTYVDTKRQRQAEMEKRGLVRIKD